MLRKGIHFTARNLKEEFLFIQKGILFNINVKSEFQRRIFYASCPGRSKCGTRRYISLLKSERTSYTKGVYFTTLSAIREFCRRKLNVKYRNIKYLSFSLFFPH